jgi:hypothetical protein
MPTDDLDSTLAFVTLVGDELAAACLLACRAQTAVRLSAVNGDLQIRAGRRSITLDAQDGMGVCALTVAAADIAALWEALRPIAHQLPAIQLFIDLEANAVQVCAADGAGFSASVPGTRA